MDAKISHSGLLARSPEGHAARGMQIKGNEDLWVEIQANTFRNWVNENLPSNMKVSDLSTDLCSGVRLCALVENLQGKRIKPSWNKNPINQHHYLENVTVALNAIEQDGVKLVNIGNVDIVNGNLKLILGLIWSLIVRYQIGRSKFPPRKLMLTWLQAVLPECRVTNLTTDWNSGILLSALIDYCRPGLFPHWKSLRENNAVENCRTAMSIAQKDLGIPAVLEPEYLASPWLDELSGMTYLSYFMKPGSPGFHATLRWVNSRLKRPVKNFTTDWNDGHTISEIIKSLGGSATGPEKLRKDSSYWEDNLNQAISAGKKLGVQPVLSAKDMADTNVEHLGVMAYAAYFQWVPERPPLHDLIVVRLESTSGRINEPTYFSVELLDKNLSYNALSTEIRAPDNKTYSVKLKNGNGSFTPQKIGMHEIVVFYNEEEVLDGHFFRVLPPMIEVLPPGMAPCALGSIVQVLVNATGAPKTEDIKVTAYSPHNRALKCPLTTIDGTSTASFKPDEAGEWRIEITYQGKQIQGGPFTCSVFDPDGVEVHGLEGALPLIPHVIEVDTHAVGVPGELHADIVHDKRSIHSRIERVGSTGFDYRLHFTPRQPGKHRVYIYFNGYDVKGSPFMMRVGTQKGKKSASSSPITTSAYRRSPTSNSRLNTPSPIGNLTASNKNNRQSASPVFGDVKHSSSDYFKSLSEKRISSTSPVPSFVDRKRPQSPISMEKLRTYSPSFNNSEYVASKKNSERISHDTYNTPSLATKQTDQMDYAINKVTHLDKEYNYTNKLSSMHISGSKSPVFMDRQIPISSRYETHMSEDHQTSYRQNKSNEIDTTPLKHFSVANDRAATRRDSWDAMVKTKNILSNSSLENSTETQMSKVEHSHYATKDKTYNSQYHQEKVSHLELQNTKTSTKSDGGAAAVKVQPVPDGMIGQPVEFEIDGSGAGSGDLEILVEGGRVTSSVRSLGGQRFIAAFTPHQALPHRVDIRFNDVTVPGSPWHVNIMSGSSLSVLGESTRLVPANSPAVFEIITSTTLIPDELNVHVISPSKRIVPSRVLAGSRSDIQQVEFVPTEVGTHIIEVSINGEKLSSGPLIAKVYDAGLIQVADVSGGVVGQPVQFRVDASQAGEGQLEISVNEGEVPNHVQVVGGGRCLVSFTPDQAKAHLIDIKFNGETVRGCPFVCSVTDISRVTLNLSHLELIPVNQPNSFHMGVAGGGAAELAVAVRGPTVELPVKVTGDIHVGFTAEFTPTQVGAHQISVDYNGRPVQGTPFIAKAFDATRVTVGTVARGSVGRPVTFSVDASEAGEGNLEITISARGLNIPTQVHPQGNARFAVSFIPAEACDHVVNVAFNKRPVMGCPLIVGVEGGGTGPSVTLPGPGPVHRASTLLINHPGRLEDIEVNVEGPGGQAVPTQVQSLGNGQFRAEFVPRAVGEHRISVSVNGLPTMGSPYSAKVYDVQAIKVKEASSGIVGKPVTFLVETSQAGPGNLEVTVNGGRVPTSAQAQGAHTYAISFTPREATPHTVDLRFNGQDVPGSPFKCVVAPAARILAPEALDKVSVGRPCQFAVESPSTPTVEVLGPARRSLQVQITPQIANPNKFDVSFTPLDVGDHSVEVRLNTVGGHVEGSPFLIKAYDANRVSVTDISDGIVGKPVSFSINASQAGAGNLEIIVAVNGRNVPNFVQSEGNARFKVNFKPTEAATHSLSVRFNGQAVPGSPFACKVNQGNIQPRLPVSGNGIELASVGIPAVIKLDGVTGLEPQIIVNAPTGKVLPVKQSVQSDVLTAHFTPEVVGRYSVAILVADQHVIGSPFSCNVYDVSKVIVAGLPGRKDSHPRSISDLSLRDNGPAEVGKAVTFSVNAAQAGEGTLELVVSTQHTTVKAEVVACARGLYDVTFVPQTCEDHFVNITFNDMPVVGSPFLCPVTEATQYIQIGSIAIIDLPSESHHLEIVDPNDQNVTYSVKNLKAEFPASLIGTYRIHVVRGNEVVATRVLHIFDASKIEVTYAPEAVCHRPAVVSISLKNAGPGKLNATVKVGNKDIAHSVRQNSSDPNLWEVVFHPVNAAPHRITLSYNGVQKPGVLEIPVRAPGTEPWAGGLGLYQARVNKVTAFTIDTLGRPAREFDVVVSGPTGSALPVRCYQTKTGRLQAEFTAQDVGPHKIEVLHQAKSLAGSPFICQAFDAQLVTLTEVPREQKNIGEKITFTLNAREAGLAELEIIATSPLSQTLPLQIVTIDEFTQQISFLPTVPGLYQLKLAYGGVPIQGSPLGFAVGLSGPQSPPRAVGPGLETAQVGERTSFTVSSILQPQVQIDAMEGSVESQMQCPKPGEYIISYVPIWVGVYDIVITCGNQQLAGSPFQPTIVDPTSVRVIGGWKQYLDENGRLKLPNKIVFDVSKAGPGVVECIIAGRKIHGEKANDRVRLDVSAEGLTSGEHDISFAFANIILTDAPKQVYSLGDQVVMTGKGLAQAQCGEPATFSIDGSRAGHGNPEVTLHAAETNLPIPVMLSLAGDKMWRAQYTVMNPGAYFLTVLWAGRPVKGCPLTVEARGGADASKVLCSGEGLRQGVVGREIRSWIDTRRAGPGELTAHCTGPRKVAYCELYDHGDATFTLNVKPQEAGRHALTIKYAGQHVPGSPFILRVAGAPDASKVRVYGPGIEHGVLATFQSRFICDTRGAGAGQLTVRVRGPKGAFRVEMQRESQKDRTILCKYDPTEPGDYRVEVKWAGELVPGSPFPVMIFDTQEELRRYLNSL